MERIADRSWLDAPATHRLAAALDVGGIAFRFVGGAVRDTLLGRKVTDIDVATPSPPDAVTHALEAAGLKVIPTGIAHGTVTALANGRHFEITTLRRDVETDGRHAVVAFTDDWRMDAARRDFTMNALYADRDGSITDFFGGVEDAKAGHVRFIGDPATRIAEDALRILRFFRFQAHYGRGAPDADGLAACARLAAKIDRLSGERVRDEILKLLKAPDPVPAWRAMVEAGIVAHLIPSATRADDLSRLVALETRLNFPADAVRRLAAVTGPMDSAAAAALKTRLRLSNRDAERLSSIDKTPPLDGPASFGRALYGKDPISTRDAALLGHVRWGAPDAETLAAFIPAAESWRDPAFPISGADIVARGIAPGPEISQLLVEIARWWIDRDFEPDRQDCLAQLDRLTR